MRKGIGIIITVLLVSAVSAAAFCAEQKLNVNLNGEPVAFSNVQPVIVNGRTLIPLRGLFEKMGYSIDWEPATKTATLIKESGIISMRSGHKALQVNQNSIILDVPAQIINNSMMIPLRAISEATGASVNWDADTKTVHIGTLTRQVSPEISIDPYIGKYMECIKPLDQVSKNILAALNSINDLNITDKLTELRDNIDSELEVIDGVMKNMDSITPDSKHERFHIRAKEAVKKLSELGVLIKEMLNDQYGYEQAETELKEILSEARNINTELNAMAAALK